MKVVGIIEARMGSTRLPGKVMLPFGEEPALKLLLKRVRSAEKLDEVIVATTDQPQDDAIEQLADSLGVDCFRGSEDDVLGRVVGALKAFDIQLHAS